MNNFLDSFLDSKFVEVFMKGMFAILIGGTIAATIAFPILFFCDYKSEKITLTKNNWACTEYREVKRHTFINTGKVMIPVTTTSDECINYKRSEK
jgi:hypothetical protein